MIDVIFPRCGVLVVVVWFGVIVWKASPRPASEGLVNRDWAGMVGMEGWLNQQGSRRASLSSALGGPELSILAAH